MFPCCGPATRHLFQERHVFQQVVVLLRRNMAESGVGRREKSELRRAIEVPRSGDGAGALLLLILGQHPAELPVDSEYKPRLHHY